MEARRRKGARGREEEGRKGVRGDQGRRKEGRFEEGWGWMVEGSALTVGEDWKKLRILVG